jgi:hypothetical protein
MQKLMKEEGEIMDYKEGVEAKTNEELSWLSSLAQLDFRASHFNRALLVYSVVGQVISRQNLVVSDSFWC